MPAELILVGVALDVALLALAAVGGRRLWRRLTRPKPPPPLPVVTAEELLAELESEGHELDRRASWLRAETDRIERFLGLPAD